MFVLSKPQRQERPRQAVRDDVRDRLAVEVALRWTDVMATEACFVDLTKAADPSLVPALVARELGVLDRDYAAGVGGVWWQDVRAAMQGARGDLLVQGYLTGVGGGDVTPETVDRVIDDVTRREAAGPPVWADVAPDVEESTLRVQLEEMVR